MPALSGLTRIWVEVGAAKPLGWELRGVVKGPRIGGAAMTTATRSELTVASPPTAGSTKWEVPAMNRFWDSRDRADPCAVRLPCRAEM